MNIRQKLIVILLLAALVPTTLLGVVASLAIGNRIAAQTLDQLTSIATKQSQKISSLLSEDQQEIGGLLNRYEFDQAVLSVTRSSSAASGAALAALITSRKADFPTIDSISVVSLTGTVLASTTPGTMGTQLSSNEYTIPAGQSTKTTLRQDPRDKLNKLYIVSDVSINAKPTAAVVTAYRLTELAAIIQDYSGLGDSGETVLAGQDQQHAVSLLALRFDSDAALHTKLDSLRLSDGDNTYSSIVNYRGHKVFAVIQGIRGTNWTIATTLDRFEALAPVNSLRSAVYIIFILTAVLMLLLSLYVARAFTVPLRLLTQKTREITLGNLQQRITLSSHDELGTLAATFNAMADQLTASYAALEKKVVERTQELNVKVQELSNSKAKDEAILSSVGDGMVVTDNAGYVLLINEVAADLLSIDRTHVFGKKTTELYELYDDSEQLIDTPSRPLQMALSTGRKTVQIVKRIQKDGKKIALSLTAAPVMQEGKIIGAIETIRDITKEKEVDRMKTEFISLASHQLRTPLSAIRWFTEMLLSGDAGKLNPEQEEFAHNVSDSTERMIQLVNSLLNISRIESGRIIIDPKPTDLQELVSGIVNDLKAKTVEKQQTLIISVHKELPKINIDPRLIGQVYLNLLSNAVKYTPKGGEISVFVSRKGDDVVSQVTDNGYGIPKAEQSKMFQKFFRAANVAKFETDGTGLGMYLVKSIVESSGGRIWFESAEGKGTTFWFTIPSGGMKAKAGEVTLDI